MQRPNGLTAPQLAALTPAIQRAATLLATNPAQAEAEALNVLKSAPEDPRALLILGSARRRQGDATAARAVLMPLATAHPRAANTQYELGATLADLGERSSALAALRRATDLNRDHVEAWRLAGDLLFSAGDAAGAERAYAAHERASVRDPGLKGAAEAVFSGDLGTAEQLLRLYLTSSPNHVEGLRMLGEISTRLGRFTDAETLLAHALHLSPGNDGARFSYAIALFRQQKAVDALPHVERLLAKAPGDPAYRNLMAACLGLVGEHDRVLEIYDSLLAQYDRQPGIWLNYGHTLRTVGRRDDAVAAYRRCIALAPGHGEAYWSLANLKVTSFSSEDEATMVAEAGHAGRSDDDRLHLHYALGKALEDRGDYAGSFSHYEKGAAIRRKQSPYDAEDTTALKERTKALFTADFFAARAGRGSSSTAPIFIVGLPRAGSTLIEQILASHSQVEGTMELPDINLIARGLGSPERAAAGPRYPDVLVGLGPAQLKHLGETFLANTQVHRKLGRPFFIDKMPNNFQHIGLIHLILPRAKIIDARRHPLGSCFSAFKQHFNQGQNFSYDLTDLGRYYRDYVGVMAHFDVIAPGVVHRVIYEDLVEDTESEVRKLLEYCGLPFEDGCLKFYDNQRAVRTVSSEQVRRPIFRDGLAQWRHYHSRLGPLEEALGDILHTWRGEHPTA
jgi:tetratricopeptide (TPR) repeat protein